jgi:hypothetical protein
MMRGDVPGGSTPQELQEAMRRGTYALGTHQSTGRARAPSGKANEGVISPPVACCGEATEGPSSSRPLLRRLIRTVLASARGPSVLAAGAGGVGVRVPSGVRGARVRPRLLTEKHSKRSEPPPPARAQPVELGLSPISHRKGRASRVALVPRVHVGSDPLGAPRLVSSIRTRVRPITGL